MKVQGFFGLVLAAAATLAMSSSAFGVTRYFLVHAGSDVSPTVDIFSIIGKPGGSGTLSTNLNNNVLDCGEEDDGLGGQQASSLYTGSYEETFILALATDNSKPGRFLQKSWIIGSRPNPGKKVTSISQTGSAPCALGAASFNMYYGAMD